MVESSARPRASRSRVSSQIGDQLGLRTDQAIDVLGGIPEQAEEEQGAELGDNAGLGSVTLGGGGELAKAIVLLGDEACGHGADLVHGLFAVARMDDGERGGDIALLPDAHGLRQFVELGGDQAVEAFAIGDVGRRLADRRLYARDLREGCVVFVQVGRDRRSAGILAVRFPRP